MSAKRIIALVLAVCIVLGGCALLFYQQIFQWINQGRESAVIAEYAEKFGKPFDPDADREIERAKRHNQELTDRVSIEDPFQTEKPVDTGDYDTLLNATGEGVMAYVEIPKINVRLPIYHGVSSAVLAKGVGHLPETSLPVGGPSTHTVLCGHSGMSNARLFTDLPKLEIGDVFYIHVYNQTLTYTVDQVKTVRPTDTSDLTIVPGEDYLTLVTCVPVTVNTHRLLVRGIRTDAED